MTTGGVMYMHSYLYGDLLLLSSMTIIILVMIVWWRALKRKGKIIHKVLNTTSLLQIVLFLICLFLYISCQKVHCMEQFDWGAMHTGNNLKLKIISHKEAGHPDLDIHYNLDELQALCASEFQLAHGLGDVRIQTLEGISLNSGIVSRIWI